MPTTSYAIAIGSNRRGRHGAPVAEVRAGIAAMSPFARVTVVSSILATAPLGPSSRRFANAAVLVESDLAPPAMLAALKAIERAFGRRGGVRWGARVIDLDIVLWSGDAYWAPDLTIPHPQFRMRRFVLDPLRAIVPDWRDPLTGLTVRQLAARAKVDRARARS